MNRFEVLNSKNSNKLCQGCNDSCDDSKPCKRGLHSQLWGVVLSGLTQMGNQWSFGVALNESSLITVVIPDDHNYLERLREHSEEFIGKFVELLWELERFYLGSIIMIEAGKTYRREFRVYPESSIIYPVITDANFLEYEDKQRDRFEVHELSYHGPHWPVHMNYWPNYAIDDEAKRVLRTWRKTSIILRTQNVEKVSSQIEKYLKLVSFFSLT